MSDRVKVSSPFRRIGASEPSHGFGVEARGAGATHQGLYASWRSAGRRREQFVVGRNAAAAPPSRSGVTARFATTCAQTPKQTAGERPHVQQTPDARVDGCCQHFDHSLGNAGTPSVSGKCNTPASRLASQAGATRSARTEPVPDCTHSRLHLQPGGRAITTCAASGWDEEGGPVNVTEIRVDHAFFTQARPSARWSRHRLLPMRDRRWWRPRQPFGEPPMRDVDCTYDRVASALEHARCDHARRLEGCIRSPLL